MLSIMCTDLLTTASLPLFQKCRFHSSPYARAVRVAKTVMCTDLLYIIHLFRDLLTPPSPPGKNIESIRGMLRHALSVAVLLSVNRLSDHQKLTFMPSWSNLVAYSTRLATSAWRFTSKCASSTWFMPNAALERGAPLFRTYSSGLETFTICYATSMRNHRIIIAM